MDERSHLLTSPSMCERAGLPAPSPTAWERVGVRVVAPRQPSTLCRQWKTLTPALSHSAGEGERQRPMHDATKTKTKTKTKTEPMPR